MRVSESVYLRRVLWKFYMTKVPCKVSKKCL